MRMSDVYPVQSHV